MANTRRFLRVNKLHTSAYTPLHLDLHEVTGKGVLTGEVVRAAATDGIDCGNGFHVDECAPSTASKLHTSTLDIRQSLANEEK
jgi:hypothetical protein